MWEINSVPTIQDTGMTGRRTATRVTMSGGVALAALSIAVTSVGCRQGAKHEPDRRVLAVRQDSPAPTPPPAPAAPAMGGRHSQLRGTQTEAICTSLSDLRLFYEGAGDQTQESLSCSMIFGGQRSADVVVFESHGSYVRVRLYDKAGHHSDGYMRTQAIR